MPTLRIESRPVSTTAASGARSRAMRRWLAGVVTAMVSIIPFVTTPTWADATEAKADAGAPEQQKPRTAKKPRKHAVAAVPPLPAPGAKERIDTALYYDAAGKFLTGEKIKGKALAAPSPKQRVLRAYGAAAGAPPQPDGTPEQVQESLVTPDDAETVCGSSKQYTQVPATAVVAVYYGWTDERRGAGGNQLPDRTTPPQEGVSQDVLGAPMYVETIAAGQHGRELRCAPPQPHQPCTYPKICVCKTYCSGSCCL